LKNHAKNFYFGILANMPKLKIRHAPPRAAAATACTRASLHVRALLLLLPLPPPPLPPR
jgi:hypothetical protein